MKQIYLISTLILFVVLSVNAQKNSFIASTRSIVITKNDSVIKANIFIHDEEIKTYDVLWYFWYNNETIGSNRGGINGKALHGMYQIFNSKSNLLLEGQFDKGLKTGKWKYWYASGELQKSEEWKNGLLHGKQLTYNEKGELVKEEVYSKGNLKTKNEKSFLKSIFSKKEKDSKQGNEVNSAESESINNAGNL